MLFKQQADVATAGFSSRSEVSSVFKDSAVRIAFAFDFSEGNVVRQDSLRGKLDFSGVIFVGDSREIDVPELSGGQAMVVRNQLVDNS